MPVCLCEALAAPDGRFEIIISTNPNLASSWGWKLGPRDEIQAPWAPKWAHGPVLDPVGPSGTLVGPVGPWGARVSLN